MMSMQDVLAIQELFDALQQAHLRSITREEERGMISFSSRRKAIERVGMPEVRQIIPELRPLLMMMRIIKEGV